MAVHKPHFESGSWRNTADMRIFFSVGHISKLMSSYIFKDWFDGEICVKVGFDWFTEVPEWTHGELKATERNFITQLPWDQGTRTMQGHLGERQSVRRQKEWEENLVQSLYWCFHRKEWVRLGRYPEQAWNWLAGILFVGSGLRMVSSCPVPCPMVI